MQQHWIRRNRAPKLIVFVLGWGCDYRCVEHIEIDSQYDIFTTYDYRTVEPIEQQVLDGYENITLFAWSFGVWVAEQLFKDVRISKAIALNGTPRPVDKELGIDPKRLVITFKGFARNGTEEFLKRTYGEAYESMKDVISPRTTDENIEELATLYDLSSTDYTPSINWDKAFVGTEDVIFPPENMVKYWGIRAQIVPLPHYPFYDTQLILREIENR